MKDAAVCIIENPKGQVLLLQRVKVPYGICLPGGKVDEGETVLRGAIRETWEETRIHLFESEMVKLGEVVSATGNYLVHVFYFKINIKDESFSPTKVILSPDEHIGYVWTTMPEGGFQLAGATDQMIKLWRDFQKSK